jgi:Bifunctional DNA primase/polymerase, N-terminal
MAWWAGYRAVYRAELKSNALGLADHGWPLLPGTYWQSDRWSGIADAPQNGPTVVTADGVAEATDDRAVIEAWWTERPYSVLIATGSVVDVIEVSALVGRRVCAQLREIGMVVPVAATPTGRWWFAVRAGEALRPELASRPEVVLHGRGDWVAAPPSEGPQGVVHWRVPPESCDWRLPEPSDLQVAVLDVVGSRPIAAPSTAAGSVGTGIRS